MGQFIFEVPRVDPNGTSAAADFFDSTLWKHSYLCGIEGVPFQTQVRLDGHRLLLQRRVETSARLLIPVWIPNIGYRTLTTCSLRPNPDGPAYDLALELARGSCMTARNQSDVWQRGGLKLDDSFAATMAAGVDAMVDAVVAGPGTARFDAAQNSIASLQSAIDQLSQQYAVQSIAYRTTRATPLATLVGAVAIPPQPMAGPSWSQYKQAMNCVAIRTSWADIETDSGALDFDDADAAVAAATEAGMRIIAGPIIDFRQRLMPHWLYLLENDFDELMRAMVQFVEKVVQRYRGKMTLWNAASGLNTPGPIGLTDEQAMRLTVSILQAVRRNDPSTAAVMSFDQPCGEYLARHRDGISPMHFADAIARSGLGLSGFGLEYRIGYSDVGTLPWSSLDIGNSVERWATLGMPLLVTVVAPGDVGVDENAIAPSPRHPLPAGESEAGMDHDAWQLRIGGAILRTLLAKPCVHGVLWDGWDDRFRHVQSHSGLVSADGQPRRMLDYFTRLKSDGVF